MADPAIPIAADWEPGPIVTHLRAAWSRTSWSMLAIGALVGALTLWLGGGLGRASVVAAAGAAPCCLALARQATGRFRWAWAALAGGVLL